MKDNYCRNIALDCWVNDFMAADETACILTDEGFNEIKRKYEKEISDILEDFSRQAADEENTVYPEGMDFSLDEVHAGIPLEYSEEVLKCAKSYLNSINCSSGIITFDIGGHGYIGSSEIMFKQVTEILLKLLNNKSGKDIHEIEKIVFQQLNPG